MTVWVVELLNDKTCELTGLCLGCLEYGKVSRKGLGWTTPVLAIWFARRCDAETAADIMASSRKTIAVEHVFS
jgi:hypothetical protein